MRLKNSGKKEREWYISETKDFFLPFGCEL